MTRTVFKVAFWLVLAVWTVLLVRPTPQDVTAELKGLNDLLPLIGIDLRLADLRCEADSRRHACRCRHLGSAGCLQS